MRLEAIELEAEEKRIACGSEAGSVVSERSRRSVRSTSSVVSSKSSLVKNAEFKRSAQPARDRGWFETQGRSNALRTQDEGATLKTTGDGATPKV